MSKGKEKKRLRSSNSSAGEDDDSKIIEKLVLSFYLLERFTDEYLVYLYLFYLCLLD